MPARILSSVLLPLPFGPMMPKNSPVSTEKLTSSSACVALVRRPVERVEEVLLERRPALVRKPERLRDAAASIARWHRGLDYTARRTTALAPEDAEPERRALPSGDRDRASVAPTEPNDVRRGDRIVDVWRG